MENTNGASEKFDNKISGDGRLIGNPLLGVADVYDNGTIFKEEVVFIGQDSVGSLMVGGMYETGRVVGRNLEIGGAFGGYLQDDSAFAARHIQPFSIATFGTTGLVPVLGAAVNYKVRFNESTYLKLNTVLSPIISNATLSLGFKF
jgi:hypothetical protein